MKLKASAIIGISFLSVSLAAIELSDIEYRCVPENAGDIRLTEVSIERDLNSYRYVVNPMKGLKFGDNVNYQGSCKFLSSTGSTMSCEWDATRLIFDPDLLKFVLSDMSPSMGFVFGVVGSCRKADS